MRDEESSMSASIRFMSLTLRVRAEVLVADLVMPWTFQPRERNFSATEPPYDEGLEFLKWTGSRCIYLVSSDTEDCNCLSHFEVGARS